ncbi:MAG TPA: ATP-binding protein [Gemmatimonadales bacterium]|nr:ATP-binding protein [Gemmatimonadales bacterium]
MRRAAIWLFWAVLLGVVTVAFRPYREQVLEAQVALTYLLVVLGGSVSGGRTLGLTLALAGSFLIDYYFQPPFDRIGVHKDVDWIVLFSFLATAAAATQLLARAREEARIAGERAEEVASLSRIGADTLNAGHPEDALGAIATVIRDKLGLTACTLEPGSTAPGPSDDTPEIEVAAGEAFPTDLPETDVIRLRLTVHDRTAGFLTLRDTAPIRLTPPKRRFLETLAYYAALAAERVPLMREAEHAAALREADRFKDIVLASVSHDLRTPLAAIKAIAGDPRLTDRDRSRNIEEQIDRLSRLVGDLLDLTKLQTGMLRIEAEANTAEDLIGALDRQLAAALGGRELSLEVDLARPALVGRFDFVKSLRALSNLAENAIRLSPPDQPVELSVERDGEFLAFKVSDRGPGVAEADRDRIFDAFYRASGSPPDAGRAGLGLNIAHRMAEMQGGSVSFAPRPGGGSVFTLRLPALDLEEPAEEGEECQVKSEK